MKYRETYNTVDTVGVHGKTESEAGSKVVVVVCVESIVTELLVGGTFMTKWIVMGSRSVL